MDRSVLPNLIIPGAMKAGTTTLHHLLDQHPNVLMSKPKEPGFFMSGSSMSLDEYKACFSTYSGEKIVGESSVFYMTDEKVINNIKRITPENRFIFLVRNPIERAYSHYYFHVWHGLETPRLSFHELMKSNEDLKREIIKFGRYDQYIPAYEQAFGSENVKTIISQNLKNNTSKTLNDVFDFIGVDNKIDVNLEESNKTKNIAFPVIYSYAKKAWSLIGEIPQQYFPERVAKIRSLVKDKISRDNRPNMSKNARKLLRETYAETIEWTRQHTGEELAQWK